MSKATDLQHTIQQLTDEQLQVVLAVEKLAAYKIAMELIKDYAPELMAQCYQVTDSSELRKLIDGYADIKPEQIMKSSDLIYALCVAIHQKKTVN